MRVQLAVARPVIGVVRVVGVVGGQQQMDAVTHAPPLGVRHPGDHRGLHQPVHLEGVGAEVEPGQGVPADLADGLAEADRIAQHPVEFRGDRCSRAAREEIARDRLGRAEGAQLQQLHGRGVLRLQLVE